MLHARLELYGTCLLGRARAEEGIATRLPGPVVYDKLAINEELRVKCVSTLPVPGESDNWTDLGTPSGRKTELIETVLLPWLQLALYLERPTLGELCWIRCAISYLSTRREPVWEARSPEEHPRLVDVLLLDWTTDRLHALVIFMRIPLAHPSTAPVVREDIVIE